MTYTYRHEPAYDLVRWAYGEPGLSTEDLMRPSNYSRARALVRSPERLSAGRTKAATCRDGIGTTMAQTFASKRAQEAYALSVELGERAYACLTGMRVRRSPINKDSTKPRKADALRADIRSRATGPAPVVLSDREMMEALGIKSVGETVGYLE